MSNGLAADATSGRQFRRFHREVEVGSQFAHDLTDSSLAACSQLPNVGPTEANGDSSEHERRFARTVSSIPTPSAT